MRKQIPKIVHFGKFAQASKNAYHMYVCGHFYYEYIKKIISYNTLLQYYISFGTDIV